MSIKTNTCTNSKWVQGSEIDRSCSVYFYARGNVQNPDIQIDVIGASGAGISVVFKYGQVLVVKTGNAIVGSLFILEVSSISGGVPTGLTEFICSSTDDSVFIQDRSILFSKCGLFVITVTQPGNAEYMESSVEVTIIASIDNLNPSLIKM